MLRKYPSHCSLITEPPKQPSHWRPCLHSCPALHRRGDTPRREILKQNCQVMLLLCLKPPSGFPSHLEVNSGSLDRHKGSSSPCLPLHLIFSQPLPFWSFSHLVSSDLRIRPHPVHQLLPLSGCLLITKVLDQMPPSQRGFSSFSLDPHHPTPQSSATRGYWALEMWLVRIERDCKYKCKKKKGTGFQRLCMKKRMQNTSLILPVEVVVFGIYRIK